MYIFLDSVPSEGKKFELDFTFEIDNTKFNILACKGFIKPNGKMYSLEFYIKASIKDICDRCLSNFEEIVESNVELLISTEQDKYIDKEEIELSDEEMSVYSAVEEKLNIKDIIIQETIMLRPQKRLCNNNCLGICPTCGVNLNTEKCACEEKTDARWQALKKYMTN